MSIEIIYWNFESNPKHWQWVEPSVDCVVPTENISLAILILCDMFRNIRQRQLKEEDMSCLGISTSKSNSILVGWSRLWNSSLENTQRRSDEYLFVVRIHTTHYTYILSIFIFVYLMQYKYFRFHFRVKPIRLCDVNCRTYIITHNSQLIVCFHERSFLSASAACIRIVNGLFTVLCCDGFGHLNEIHFVLYRFFILLHFPFSFSPVTAWHYG